MKNYVEQSCLIIKPDGIGKRKIGEVIKRLENKGLKILALKMLKPKRRKIENFYKMHRGKHFFEPFIYFMLSGPIIVSVWEGKGAISLIRETIGATNSLKAANGSLRRLYGTDGRKNLVHASDSKVNAEREIKYFFKNSEVLDYDAYEWLKR